MNVRKYLGALPQQVPRGGGQSTPAKSLKPEPCRRQFSRDKGLIRLREKTTRVQGPFFLDKTPTEAVSGTVSPKLNESSVETAGSIRLPKAAPHSILESPSRYSEQMRLMFPLLQGSFLNVFHFLKTKYFFGLIIILLKFFSATKDKKPGTQLEAETDFSRKSRTLLRLRTTTPRARTSCHSSG